MAVSPQNFTGSVTLNTDKYSCYIRAIESNVTDGVDNKSTVTVEFHIVRNNWGWITGTSYSGKIVIDGTTYSFSYSPSWPAGSSGDVIIATKSKTVTHNSDGSKNCSISAEWNTSGTYSCGKASASGTYTLTNIPRQAILTGADNFNDEQNPKITYSNPAGDSVTTLQACISLTGAVADVPYRNISKTGTSYTFNLTETERNTLRNSIPNSTSRTVKFLVKTVIGGNTYYSTLEKTFTIVNGNPVFTNFNYEDIDAKTLALTGDNQKIIKKYSDVKITIPVADKMTAIKGALPSKYTAIIGTQSIDINYSDTLDVFNTINNANSNMVSVFAKDSRNNQTQVTKALDVINYTEPKISSMFFNRKDGVGETVEIVGTGTYDSVDFGTVTNTIKSIEFNRKEKTSDLWEGWTSITGYFDILNGNVANKDASEILGVTWTFGVEYDVQVRFTDELSTATYNLSVGSGKVLWTALKNKGVCFSGIYDESLGGAVQCKGDVIVDGMLTHQSEDLNNLDCNTLIGRVIYGYGNDMVNRPSNRNGYFTNTPHAAPQYRNTYNYQTYFERPSGRLWTRNMENGVWTNWALSYDSENSKMTQLWAGSAGEGTTVTLNDNINNYKFVYIRLNESASYIIIPVLTGNGFTSVRGMNVYTGGTNLEIQAVRATHLNNGTQVQVTTVYAMTLTPPSALARVTSYNAVTEIWGVR